MVRCEAGAGGAVFVVYTVEGLGHHWPGGRGRLSRRLFGPPSDRIRANELIEDFFRQQLGEPGRAPHSGRSPRILNPRIRGLRPLCGARPGSPAGERKATRPCRTS